MNDDPDCHQTWPLPLLKKSVKNRKLSKKLDSSLKPFGQMNIILKEYYIYVSNLIAIYSKGFFWIFLLILPLCSIYRHGGQDGWSEGSSDITFKGNPLRMIQAKIGLTSGFRGEDF
jgi:hypothetical protein